MYTQCPECGTVFKVTPDVLRVARGVVRCGVCDGTFNAVQYLTEQPKPVLPSGANTPRPAPRPAAPTPTPAGLASLHAQVAAFQAAQPDPTPTGRFAARLASSLREGAHERVHLERAPAGMTLDEDESPSADAIETTGAAPAAPPVPPVARRPSDAEIEAAGDEALEFDAESTDWNSVFIAAPPPGPAPTAPPTAPPAARAGHREPAAVDTHAPDGLDELPPEDDEPGIPLAQRPDAEAIERLFRETAAAAVGLQQKSLAGQARHRDTDPAALDVTLPEIAGATPLDLPLTEAPPAPAFAAEGFDADDFDGIEFDAAADSEHIDIGEAATEASEGMDTADGDVRLPPPEPEPEPSPDVIELLRPPRRAEPLTITMPEPSAPSTGYAIAAVAALIVLGAQATHYWRESIATVPVIGPLVSRAYEAVGHPIEPRWSLSTYDVKQLGASSDVPGTLRLLARVQNRASRAQPYPLLRVTLLDRFETKIARREFTPAEYLPSRRAPEGLLPPEQRVDADLLLADPGNDAVSFELDLCLPDHGRLNCAQDQRTQP